MLEFPLLKSADSRLSILCIGSHCDDIEIGCGGTVLKLLESYKNAHVDWVVCSSSARRESEARSSADMFLRNAGSRRIIINDFNDGFFPYKGAEIKEYFERLKQDVTPNLVLTHYRNDLHQDHRVISELTWNTFRNHLILEYEIPKYDGDLAAPNLFVHLNEEQAHKKVGFILDAFESQREKHWFDKEAFLAILRLRGIESCSRYAEAFYSRKVVLA